MLKTKEENSPTFATKREIVERRLENRVNSMGSNLGNNQRSRNKRGLEYTPEFKGFESAVRK
jgi:hypothetical protein